MNSNKKIKISIFKLKEQVAKEARSLVLKDFLKRLTRFLFIMPIVFLIIPFGLLISFLERLISIFSDKGDVVIDCCAGSGSSLVAAANLDRKAYGFEIKKEFCQKIENIAFKEIEQRLF